MDGLFPPLLKQALEKLAHHDLVRFERKLGPFLRDVLLRTDRDSQDLYAFFPTIPLSEALAALRAFECLKTRVRTCIAGSMPHLEQAIRRGDVHTIVRIAFEELAECE